MEQFTHDLMRPGETDTTELKFRQAPLVNVRRPRTVWDTPEVLLKGCTYPGEGLERRRLSGLVLHDRQPRKRGRRKQSLWLMRVIRCSPSTGEEAAARCWVMVRE